jgi:hypothetical protein
LLQPRPLHSKGKKATPAKKGSKAPKTAKQPKSASSAREGSKTAKILELLNGRR